MYTQFISNSLWPSLSIVASLLLAKILLQSKWFEYINHRSSRYTSIDGLRGFLAIGVFFHHFIITWHWKNTNIWSSPPSILYSNFGHVGVATFFMITGFLFSSKILQHKINNWMEFYKQRIFRIYPLYIVAILAVTTIVFCESRGKLYSNPQEIAKQYAQWLLFHGMKLNNFDNTQNIMATVFWTLKYEWLFYLSLPLLAILFRNKYSLTASLALAILAYIYPSQLGSFKSEYIILFAAGSTAAILKEKFRRDHTHINSWIISCTSCLLLLGALLQPSPLGPTQILLITGFFFLTALGNNFFGLFSLRTSSFLGEISYSVYLLHGIVLYAIFTQLKIINLTTLSLEAYMALMPPVCATIIVISTISFLSIERPGINFGKNKIF